MRRKHRCSVFLLDLDRFKAVNDTLGHPAGDTLLRLVSLRLRDEVGELGQVGRLGGDEFEVVLPATSSKEDLSKLAQGIIDSLSRPYTINGTAVSIGASVGIVTSDYDDRTSDDLMRDADLALYAAKAAGKGCFRFFAPEMHEAARQRQLMESDLRVALEKGQLRVVFQPSVDASSEAVTGFEALIRWDHPEHGPVSPAHVHPAGRGNRPDQRDRRVGAADGLRRSGEMARRKSRSRSICRRSSSRSHSLPATVRARY